MLSRPTSQIKTLGALREAGYRPRSIKQEMRDNLRARLAAGGPALPRHPRLRPHGDPVGDQRPARRPRLHPPRPARPGEDPHPALAGHPARRGGAGASPAAELNDDPLAPISTCGQRLVQEAGDDAPVEWMTARAALQREAGDAGRLDRRPPRRHRSDQGGDPQAHLRRSGGHPLRDHPAHQPRHLRHQRAARPRAAHPGRPVQHPRGARPADPRLSRCASRSTS